MLWCTSVSNDEATRAAQQNSLHSTTSDISCNGFDSSCVRSGRLLGRAVVALRNLQVAAKKRCRCVSALLGTTTPIPAVAACLTGGRSIAGLAQLVPEMPDLVPF